jgi:hypothetical protein
VSEPAAALTDLALGLITLLLTPLLRGPRVNPNWRRTEWWAAASALGGFVHHGVMTAHRRLEGPSWAVISGMVVITISFSLAATVSDVLGPGRRRVFWLLRTASLGAYGFLALLGHYGIGTILACEGVTMVCVLVLWGVALARHDPRAPRMMVALGTSALAGCMRALPSSVTDKIGLDPTSVYHLAQIPPMVLLCRAVGNGQSLLRRRRMTVALADEGS